MPTVEQYRETLLLVAGEFFDLGEGYFQERVILKESARRLSIDGGGDSACELLTEFHKFFEGEQAVFAPGCDLDNPGLPFMHLTDIGRVRLGKARLAP